MFNIPMPRASNKDDAAIIALCRGLVVDEVPIYLEFESTPGAVVNECYGNVEEMIKKEGGSIQYGWQIWDTLPGVMAEAEFHAVWVDSTGLLHDITPKNPPTNRILFLPDPEKKFIGAQIDNKRIPLKDDPLIREFIKTAEQLYKASNEGDLAGKFGEIIATPRMLALMKSKQFLELQLLQKYYL